MGQHPNRKFSQHPIQSMGDACIPEGTFADFSGGWFPKSVKRRHTHSPTLEASNSVSYQPGIAVLQPLWVQIHHQLVVQENQTHQLVVQIHQLSWFKFTNSCASKKNIDFFRCRSERLRRNQRPSSKNQLACTWARAICVARALVGCRAASVRAAF